MGPVGSEKHRLKTANLLCVTPQKSDDLIYTKKKPDIAHAIFSVFIPQTGSNCELGFQRSTHAMEHGRLNRTLINKKLYIYIYIYICKVWIPRFHHLANSVTLYCVTNKLNQSIF
jgi:hypothetical protein